MARRDVRELKLTKHHIVPKSRNGTLEPWNVLRLPRYKHDAWHLIFNLKTIDECIAYLRALKREQDEFMESSRVVHDLRLYTTSGNFDPFNALNFSVDKHTAWYKLFGGISLDDAIFCLADIKRNQENLKNGFGSPASAVSSVL